MNLPAASSGVSYLTNMSSARYGTSSTEADKAAREERKDVRELR